MKLRILVIHIIIFTGFTSCLAFSPARGKHAMVVTANRLASEIGIEILKKGGNAVDAAVAVGFALAVVFPEAGNIGGGGFMLMRKNDGKTACIDFRETAPIVSAGDMYIDSSGKVTDKIIRGALSAGVPGTVAGLLEALSKYGTMKLSQLINPAIKLANDGFIVDLRLEQNILNYEKELRQFPSTVKTFFKNTNRYIQGDTLRQPDLARTLIRIRNKGWSGFYRGKTARLIVDAMKRGGGIITEKDLSRYKSIIRKPITGTYRSYDIVSCPLPSSGGTCLIEMLNILEQYNLASLGFHSSKSVHIITEAMKRVYADRSEYMGDPAYAFLPESILISKGYASSRRKEIDSMHAAPAVDIHPGRISIKEHNNTTHYSVIDKYGNCAAVTYTVNDIFGSQLIVDGAGFFLNNEMDDFSAKPGTPNSYGLLGGSANAIEAGKRPLSSMAPTIVMKDGKPVMILGARGGSAIITALLQTILNVIDYGMNIETALNSPRFHHQWMPDTVFTEKYCLPRDVIQNLISMGQNPSETSNFYGAVQAIYVDGENSVIYGSSDPREGGMAAGD